LAGLRLTPWSTPEHPRVLLMPTSLRLTICLWPPNQLLSAFRSQMDKSQSAQVTHKAIMEFKIGRHHETTPLNVTKLSYPIMLGISWLKRHDPWIQWSQHRITFNSPFCTKHHCWGTKSSKALLTAVAMTSIAVEYRSFLSVGFLRASRNKCWDNWTNWDVWYKMFWLF
jgi:hypothetical protein